MAKKAEPKQLTMLKTADDVGVAMALALARTLLRKGLVDDADIAEMIDRMEATASAHVETNPRGASSTRRGAKAFRQSLSNDPGVKLPLVLTAQ